jgi:hypothetical protein
MCSSSHGEVDAELDVPAVNLPGCPAGEFDAQFLLKELPTILDIEEKRVRMLLKELVGARK